MNQKLKLVKVDCQYCDFLRNYDHRVPYNAGTKDLRPFIGILFMIGDCEYFAPLSSPKAKHQNLKNTLDLLKIKNGEYGVVNFNNMIPVTKQNYVDFDLDRQNLDPQERNRIELLRNQLRWLTSHKKEITLKSKLLYQLYQTDKLPSNVKNRCCNFILLESILKKYNHSN